MMRIIASLTEGGDRCAHIARNRARRLRLIQARVLSTIQRLGRMTNLCSSLRLTISTAQWPVLAVACVTRGPWYPASAKMRSIKGNKRGAPVENQSRPIAILNVGRMNNDVQQQAERIDQD